MPDINNVRTINELERKQTVIDSDAFAVSNESGTFSATAAQIRDNTLSGGGIAPAKALGADHGAAGGHCGKDLYDEHVDGVDEGHG